MSMLARIIVDPQDVEQRRTPRRTLRLDIDGATATVRNLSETGLLIESPNGLEVGDRVSIDLPMADLSEARVIWARAPFYGCEFVSPISRAAVSAALLRAPIDEPPVTLLGPSVTGWQIPEEVPPLRSPRSTGGALALLAALGAAIACLILALASLPTV
ncbi:PilZ domain-containing protein [Novosphingobium sp. Gsoil 351]|uniref:PilZ domain-containing protein n=1 Tax=Novosphingobium sp. Gsoil 351 TaxID=2675225 RepID=UPI0012B456FF|nr:PilZ domain-containing protein [Novosphingobium sp. Gsoil 351]QGN53316.1 hypothetical protein GKE62_00855 [Novosphingobium sp. Gsoil 351]